jgi:hypothetical protein
MCNVYASIEITTIFTNLIVFIQNKVKISIVNKEQKTKTNKKWKSVAVKKPILHIRGKTATLENYLMINLRYFETH